MNEFQNYAYGAGQQLAPQGIFGSLLGAPLGGLIGRGIGGLFGNANLGRQIGQAAGGIGGGFLPFAADPVTAAYAQQAQQQQLEQQLQQQHLLQQQLAPQGWFGNLIGQVGRPLGGAIGGLFGNAGLGSTIGGVAGQLGQLLPFGADPVAQAYAQQAQQAQLAQLAQQGQLAPQGWFGNLIGQVGRPLGGAIGGIFGNAGLGSTIGGVAGQLGRMLPFDADPVAQAYAQQAQQAQLAQLAQLQQGQLAPQGWFGNLIGQVGRPLGGAIGGIFGNAGLGSTIGGVAGQLGRMLPFDADPVAQAYAQQAQQAQLAQLQQQGQLAPQGWFGNLIGQVGRPLGGAIGGIFGNAGLGSTIGGVAGRLGSMLPFAADPVAQQIAQQQQQQQLQQLQQLQHIQQQQAEQFAPQGWFGNLLGQVGRPLGSAIGGIFGNANLGGTIGGAAGQLGQLLPFGADPVSQQLAQQQQEQVAQLMTQGAMPINQSWLSNIMKQHSPYSQFGTGMCSPSMGRPYGQFLPFGADPVSAAYAQQAQLAQQMAPNSLYSNQSMPYAGEPTLH
jgi:septal ring factor EnvC (AmiA/AmiB activator)